MSVKTEFWMEHGEDTFIPMPGAKIGEKKDLWA